MNGLDKIYVKELSHELGLTDLRSVRRYCSMNGIAILRDSGSRSLYVIRSDYEAGRMREFIKVLKNRHGKDWVKAYQAHVDCNIELLLSLQSGGKKNQSAAVLSHGSLCETSEDEQRFLDEVESLLNKS